MSTVALVNKDQLNYIEGHQCKKLKGPQFELEIRIKSQTVNPEVQYTASILYQLLIASEETKTTKGL